jgi:hypothetical protein
MNVMPFCLKSAFACWISYKEKNNKWRWQQQQIQYADLLFHSGYHKHFKCERIQLLAQKIISAVVQQFDNPKQTIFILCTATNTYIYF